MLFSIGGTGKHETSGTSSGVSGRKNMWQDFADFLEEEDEQKTEAETKPEVKSIDAPDLIAEQSLGEAVQRWKETPAEIFPDKTTEKPKTKRTKRKTTKKKQ